MKDSILISYCFLAALTESKNDLFKGVYVPIVKRALSYYSLNNHSFGHDTNVQNLLNELYGISAPLLVIRQLLKTIEAEMSKKEKINTGFNTFDNGKSFGIQKYSFLDIEEYYKEGERNAKSIQLAFENFLKEQQEPIEEVASFSDFLSKNKTKLSSFFSGRTIANGEFEKSFINHVNFLEVIERNHHELFKIAESIYLGSIVASLFECEFDFEAKNTSGEIYYLDTQIVLKALDLQSEADTRPIQELLNLVKEAGGKLKVLDITMSEIAYNLNLAIDNYNASLPTSSINEACLRKKKNKAWLIAILGNFETYLKKELSLEVELLPTSSKEKFEKTIDIHELKISRKKQANAEHDVFSYLFVREKRGGIIKTHQKAKIWFVTANKRLLFFNIEKVGIGNVPEITLPDTLTTLLWLRDPVKLVSRVKSIGLNQLIANTLHDEIATKELINEFDSNLRTVESINNEDYQVILESLAHQSAKNIERLNQMVVENRVEEFSAEAHKIVDKERRRRASTQESIRKAKEEQKQTTDENLGLKAALERIENELKGQSKISKSELELLSTEVFKTKRYIKRVVISFLILSFCGLGLYFVLNSIQIWSVLKIIFTSIVSLGGLWAFGSFIINLLKSLSVIK